MHIFKSPRLRTIHQAREWPPLTGHILKTNIYDVDPSLFEIAIVYHLRTISAESETGSWEDCRLCDAKGRCRITRSSAWIINIARAKCVGERRVGRTSTWQRSLCIEARRNGNIHEEGVGFWLRANQMRGNKRVLQAQVRRSKHIRLGQDVKILLASNFKEFLDITISDRLKETDTSRA